MQIASARPAGDQHENCRIGLSTLTRVVIRTCPRMLSNRGRERTLSRGSTSPGLNERDHRPQFGRRDDMLEPFRHQRRAEHPQVGDV